MNTKSTALRSEDKAIRNAEIVAQRAAGVPAADIAAEAGISVSMVYRVVSEAAKAQEAAPAPIAEPAAPEAPEADEETPLADAVEAYLEQLAGGNAADRIVGDLLTAVARATGEERRKAIIECARYGIERKHIAAAAGVKSVGRYIRAAQRAGEL